MKKYSYLLAALTLVIAACSKEVAVVEDSISEQKEGTVVILSAVPPQFSDDTKASVDNLSFSWDDGDQISIPATGNVNGYVVFTHLSTYKDNEFRGTLNPGEALESGTAHYPVSNATPFSSIALAKKGFKMEAVYTVGDASLAFEHKSALVHLTFTNVPSFANKLVVNDGSSDVAVINFTSPSSSQEFWVPIDPVGSSKTYEFRLQENSNVLKKVSKIATLAANKYYNATTPVPVGRIIRVQDAVDWGSKELYIWNASNTLENKCFTTSETYPYIFNTISSSDHYIVIPSELTWATATTKVGVKFQDSGASNHTETAGVYLLRDVTFTVPSSPAEYDMHTDYYIYPKSSTGTVSNATVYVFYQPYKIYAKNTSGGSIVLHTWKDGQSGTDISDYEIDGDYCVFTLSRSWKSVKCNFGFKHSDGTDWGGDQNVTFGDSYQRAYLEYKGNNNTEWKSGDNTIAAVVLNGAYPGNSISSLTTTVNAATYYAVSSSYFGKEVSIIFNSGSEWYPVINQDYDYDLK